MTNEPKIKKLHTARKCDGDCPGSYAVFLKKDIKGMKGVIMTRFTADGPVPRPIVNGCTRREATYYVDKFNREAHERATETV
jgi:hypothetical protein